MLVWRLRKKKNWVGGRSACSHCKHILSPKDLVPVISWLLLRGKCRYCNKPITDSPLTEIAVALLFVGSYVYWPTTFDTQGWFVFTVWLVAIVLLSAMFIYDIRWMILPDKLTIGLFWLAVLQLVVLFFWNDFDLNILTQAIFSALVGGAVFHLIYSLSKGKYIGGGDVKLGYAYGLLLLEPVKPWLVLTIASIIGTFVSTFLLITKRAKMNTRLPFGPLLIIGVVVVALWGERIWSYIGQIWY